MKWNSMKRPSHKNTFYQKKLNFESLENGIFGKKFFFHC
jgi:hypothetical protein